MESYLTKFIFRDIKYPSQNKWLKHRREKKMVTKRDFVQEANAKRGKEIGDAEILETCGGETRKTTITINTLGKEMRKIEADSQLRPQ